MGTTIEKHTSWTEATESPYQATIGLISCLKSGRNAWIELQRNGNQDFPIKTPNPELANPFNWTMLYGIPRDNESLANHHYLNDTEKDLTYNWQACFADKEAADEYIATGKPTKGLLKGMGVCIPVKTTDAESLREDGYKYGAWVTFWQPKDNIPYWIPADIERVYVVCFNNEPVNERESLRKAGEFLLNLAQDI